MGDPFYTGSTYKSSSGKTTYVSPTGSGYTVNRKNQSTPSRAENTYTEIGNSGKYTNLDIQNSSVSTEPYSDRIGSADMSSGVKNATVEQTKTFGGQNIPSYMQSSQVGLNNVYSQGMSSQVSIQLDQLNSS